MASVASAFNLSPADVGEQIGVHEDTIKRWAAKGKLRGLKTPGGWWRFSQADVNAFIDASSSHGGDDVEASAS